MSRFLDLVHLLVYLQRTLLLPNISQQERNKARQRVPFLFVSTVVKFKKCIKMYQTFQIDLSCYIPSLLFLFVTLDLYIYSQMLKTSGIRENPCKAQGHSVPLAEQGETHSFVRSFKRLLYPSSCSYPCVEDGSLLMVPVRKIVSPS